MVFQIMQFAFTIMLVRIAIYIFFKSNIDDRVLTNTGIIHANFNKALQSQLLLGN